MTEQYSSLNEKAHQIDIALKFTGGDMAKAKAMVAGQYQDVVAVKGKFVDQSTGKSGLFFIFVNIFEEYICNIYTVTIVGTTLFDKMRVFDDWKTLFNDAISYSSGGDVDPSSDALNAYLLESVIANDIFPEVEEQNLDELSKKLKNILQNYFQSTSVQSQIDLSQTNSLLLEIGGVSVDIPPAYQGGDESTGESKVQVAGEEDDRIKRVEAEAKYIVDGAIIVSPVSGKYINDIELGEVIKVILPGRDGVTAKLISVLNARRSDGTIAPVKGRVKAKIPLEKGGYTLYALVAKGVMAKIVEEENVKIQVDIAIREELEKSKSENRFIYIAAAVLILVIIAIIAIIISL